MADGYYGTLIAEAEDQEKHPYLYSPQDVRELRSRLADALDELWKKQ